MRAISIVYSALSAALCVNARSWQHVGRKTKEPVPPRYVSSYLETRQVLEPKFANDNTTSAFPEPLWTLTS